MRGAQRSSAGSSRKKFRFVIGVIILFVVLIIGIIVVLPVVGGGPMLRPRVFFARIIMLTVTACVFFHANMLPCRLRGRVSKTKDTAYL